MKQKIRVNDAVIIAGLWPTLKAVPTIAPWAEVQIRNPYSMNVMTRIMYRTLFCTQRQKEVDGSVIGYSKNSRILCAKVFNEVHSAGLRILFFFFPCHSFSFFLLLVCFIQQFHATLPSRIRSPRVCLAYRNEEMPECAYFIRHACPYFHSCVRPHETYNTKTDECRYQKSVNIFQILLKSGNNTNTLREYLRGFLCTSRK